MEKLTQDSPLFTNYEQEHAFYSAGFVKKIHLNPPFPLVSFIPSMSETKLEEINGESVLIPLLEAKVFVDQVRGSVT